MAEQGDEVGFADRLERLLRDGELRRRLGANARDRVRAEFDQWRAGRSGRSR